MNRNLLLAVLLPLSAHAASTGTAVNDVPADLKTLYRRMALEVDPRLQSGDYLGAVAVAREYLEKQQDADTIGFLLDVQTAAISAVGDYEGALVSMSRNANLQGRAQPPRVYDDQAWASARRQVRWEEPEAVLRDAAKTHSVIMISEAHHVPETRAFGTRMLPLLRSLGFEYLAMETLKYPVPDKPVRVAISTGADTAAGFYFLEPQLAGLVREALKEGFKLVAYEDETTGDDREGTQAGNLYERLLKDKPDAKVVVWAGFGHVYKRRSPSFGTKAMAQRLWEMTGKEPFCLYQIADALDPYFADVAFYKPLVLDDTKRPPRALVLRDRPGLFPALDAVADNGLGLTAEGLPIVEGYVVHPPFAARAPGRLRPAWLARDGVFRIDGTVAGVGKEQVLLQAFPAAEGVHSSPADQMVVDASGRFELWLPRGEFVLRLRDAKGAVLLETRTVVGPAGGALALVLPR